jgi:hypothetical protein
MDNGEKYNTNNRIELMEAVKTKLNTQPIGTHHPSLPKKAKIKPRAATPARRGVTALPDCWGSPPMNVSQGLELASKGHRTQAVGLAGANGVALKWAARSKAVFIKIFIVNYWIFLNFLSV